MERPCRNGNAGRPGHDTLGLQLDIDMLLFALALSVTTGLLFGLFPAIHSTRPNLVAALKASAGQLYGWDIYNNATSERYVKLYNALIARVSVGTTTPHITIVVPGKALISQYIPTGTPFNTAISAAAAPVLAPKHAIGSAAIAG